MPLTSSSPMLPERGPLCVALHNGSHELRQPQPRLVATVIASLGQARQSCVYRRGDRTVRTLRQSAFDSGAINPEDVDQIGNAATVIRPF